VFDNSNSLDPALYTKERDLITSRALDGFTHFERLGIGYYSNSPSIEEPGYCLSLDCIQGYVDQADQNLQKGPSIRRALQSVANNIKTAPMEQAFVFFVSQITDSDVENALEYAEKITPIAWLSLIGVQGTVQQDKLDQLANYSAIIDLNNRLPDDLDSIFSKAYGCPTQLRSDANR